MWSNMRTLTTVLVLASQLAEAQADMVPTTAPPAAVQVAVEKGLFFVEYQSMRWWKGRKCATCHEGQMLMVAANVAKSQGVPVDQDRLDLWTDRWVLTDALAKDAQGRLNGLGIPTAPFVLLHRARGRDPSSA